MSDLINMNSLNLTKDLDCFQDNVGLHCYPITHWGWTETVALLFFVGLIVFIIWAKFGRGKK